VRSDQAYGINLIWSDSDTLNIEYLSAKNATLNSESTSIDGDPIHVKLESGINDPKAPAILIYFLSPFTFSKSC
jgi:hypothetical protein